MSGAQAFPPYSDIALQFARSLSAATYLDAHTFLAAELQSELTPSDLKSEFRSMVEYGESPPYHTEVMNMASNPGLIPILHISAHGFSEGIQLSSGEVLDWASLRELLKPLNEALNGALFVCMSTCEGYSGSRMAMVLDDPDHPFIAIVGNSGKPTWPEAAVAFASFYHLVANGHYVSDAVTAMGVASGNNRFFVTTAE